MKYVIVLLLGLSVLISCNDSKPANGSSHSSRDSTVLPAVEAELPSGHVVNLQYVPAGAFDMGDPAYNFNKVISKLTTENHNKNAPYRKGVSISKSYLISNLLSNELGIEFLKTLSEPSIKRCLIVTNESSIVYDEGQLTNVIPGGVINCFSYWGAEQFCKWLSNKLKSRVTLPTEAQWEYSVKYFDKNKIQFYESSIIGSWCSDFYSTNADDMGDLIDPSGPPVSSVSTSDGIQMRVIRRYSTMIPSRVMARDGSAGMIRSSLNGIQVVINVESE
ncbi:MAG: formylglycine-generating enzyme family protein [Candidatus Marinimicrobia bacterium]|nr:formylglycine-generating enzyme family protein [Candidatus Neomarinimicrobiota bacterium]